MNILQTIFGKEKDIIIGALHLPPLLGYDDFPGLSVARENAIADLMAFEEGGVDAVIVENNYDIPHTEHITSSVFASMFYLTECVSDCADIPLGVSVLWNDYKSALSIAKVLDLKFVRVPVFVDDVKTDYGIIKGNPNEVTDFRSEIDADNVALFTDIHVKHAEIISKYSIVESAEKAINSGADAIIVTGSWTGNAPNTDELIKVRRAVNNFPILCGSGVNHENIDELFSVADGAIVSTSLKEENKGMHPVNKIPYSARIDADKVAELVLSLRSSV